MRASRLGCKQPNSNLRNVTLTIIEISSSDTKTLGQYYRERVKIQTFKLAFLAVSHEQQTM